MSEKLTIAYKTTRKQVIAELQPQLCEMLEGLLSRKENTYKELDYAHKYLMATIGDCEIQNARLILARILEGDFDSQGRVFLPPAPVHGVFELSPGIYRVVYELIMINTLGAHTDWAFDFAARTVKFETNTELSQEAIVDLLKSVKERGQL